MKGTGAPPDWYDGKKYKTVYDQAKARRDAEALIGTQTTKIQDLEKRIPKAPEAYVHKLPDQYKDAFEIKADDPSFTALNSIAKKHNLSQEAFDEIFQVGIGLIANYELTDAAQEKQLIGENADARMQTVNDWAKANLTPEQAESMSRAFGVWSRPADVFKLMESIIAGKKEPALPRAEGEQSTSVDAINKEFRTPDPTTKKAKIDTPEGRAQYRERLRAVVGDGEHMVVRGKR